MRCTAKKHFDVAAEANITLIVQTTDNQPTLHQQIQEIAATEAPLGSAQSRDTGRNRGETRTVSVFDPADNLADTDWHSYVAAVIRVERDVFTRDARTGLLRYATETSFYVANTPLTAARAAEAVRAHWRIETTSHYSRDVTFGEDRSPRVRGA
jgi:hypothetical protein